MTPVLFAAAKSSSGARPLRGLRPLSLYNVDWAAKRALPLELNAVGTLWGHGFHPLKAQLTLSNH
jgi:hypothetical protein